MKQFLQIHNTDCNKRTIFRTFLQWENEKLKRRDAKTLRFILNTENTEETKFAPCGAWGFPENYSLRLIKLKQVTTMTRKFNPEN